MWDPPGPGHEPVSPALAGGFSTTAPPGKPCPVTIDSHLPFTGAFNSLFYLFNETFFYILYLIILKSLRYDLFVVSADSHSGLPFLHVLSYLILNLYILGNLSVKISWGLV